MLLSSFIFLLNILIIHMLFNILYTPKHFIFHSAVQGKGWPIGGVQSASLTGWARECGRSDAPSPVVCAPLLSEWTCCGKGLLLQPLSVYDQHRARQHRDLLIRERTGSSPTPVRPQKEGLTRKSETTADRLERFLTCVCMCVLIRAMFTWITQAQPVGP